ncbi:hypothetical protein [Achromobacter xylosoxidans]|uniref:hypothetical protein n=1 Tax=Alcaligenes xylosoxydans xylosoxydans TaxID=85698 RepID=UPI0006BFEA62|nr:hypothetical protein [Achromobacter xylosoxidans]CUJ55285.1 Uncharacterised protein [Achromobacter xylosoxidans]
MNTISASAPPARIRPLRIIAQAARKLGDFISPRNHAGKGNWSQDADIHWWAWPAGAAFAAFFLFGPLAIGRLLSVVL